MTEQIRICIEEKGIIYKVSSIYLLNDGSFKLDVPYCPYDEGFVFKYPIDYSKRKSEIPVSSFSKKFKAQSRPQLSIQASGFIQFSGQGITSGLDELGKPKGVGVYSNPLDRPVRSGPTLGATLWGINKYKEAKGLSPKEIILRENDFIKRILRDEPLNSPRNTILNTYIIEIFVLTENFGKRIRKTDKGEVLTLDFPQYYECPGAIFTFPIIRLLNHTSFLGILPFIGNTEWPEKSEFGFQIGGPSGPEKIGGTTALYACSVPKKSTTLEQAVTTQ